MKYETLSDSKKRQLEEIYGVFGNRILIADSKTVLPPTIRLYYDRYKAFECLSSDVWVVSYPKSGTTWTQEMVWCLLNNFDYEAAKNQLLMKRFPFFEWDGCLPENYAHLDPFPVEDPCAPGETWKILHTLKEPRTIKSHLHFSILPGNIQEAKSKIIYICRDPRDVCVSYYYHSQKYDGYLGSFDDFFDLFVEDLHFFSPYWRHVLDFWNLRNQENVLFLRYEDLKEDLESNVKKVATFMGKDVSNKEMDGLLEHLSFDKMKTQKSVNNEALTVFGCDDSKPKFMRKGVVGDWKSHLSSDQIQRINQWTKDGLKNSDFPYYKD